MAKKSKGLKNNKNVMTIALVAIVALIGITIAYAATLSRPLNITANTIMNSNQFDVHFKSQSSISGTASNSITGTTTGITCGTATASGATVTVADTTLNLPGDTCTYQLTVQNASTVNVKLNSIAKIDSGTQCGSVSGAAFTCGNITFKLATNAAGTTALTTSQTIAKKSGSTATEATIYLVVTHKDHDASGLVSSTTTYTGKGFKLTYAQN